MSDDSKDLTISPEELEKAKAWFESKWPEEKHACEVCGNNSWHIGHHLVTPLTYKKGINIGGIAYPFFIVGCSNCGNTKFFNALQMGLLRNKEEPDVTK